MILNLFLVSGKSSSTLVNTCLIIGNCLSSFGETTKAIEFYHHAITILESISGAEAEELIIILAKRCSLLIEEVKAKDAETHLRSKFRSFYLDGLLYILLYLTEVYGFNLVFCLFP